MKMYFFCILVCIFSKQRVAFKVCLKADNKCFSLFIYNFNYNTIDKRKNHVIYSKTIK